MPPAAAISCSTSWSRSGCRSISRRRKVRRCSITYWNGLPKYAPVESMVRGTRYSWVSEPSRVQITPQALASGLASRCPARSRQSGTPRSTSRRQKPSIRSSGAEFTRASPISQRAISSAARSTLSGCSTSMSACQDDSAALRGGPGLANYLSLRLQQDCRRDPPWDGWFGAGEPARASRPEPVVVRAPDLGRGGTRAVPGSGLGSSSGRPHNR